MAKLEATFRYIRTKESVQQSKHVTSASSKIKNAIRSLKGRLTVFARLRPGCIKGNEAKKAIHRQLFRLWSKVIISKSTVCLTLRPSLLAALRKHHQPTQLISVRLNVLLLLDPPYTLSLRGHYNHSWRPVALV
ncbi:MAG: hypothetical protein Q9227_007960 [Pyrenula ochraceoflavens]